MQAGRACHATGHGSFDRCQFDSLVGIACWCARFTASRISECWSRRALLPLGDEREQIQFCERIQTEGWSVRLTELRVQEFLDGDDQPAITAATVTTEKAPAKSKRAGAKSGPTRTRSSQIVSLEQQLRQALGTKIEFVKHRAVKVRSSFTLAVPMNLIGSKNTDWRRSVVLCQRARARGNSLFMNKKNE